MHGHKQHATHREPKGLSTNQTQAAGAADGHACGRHVNRPDRKWPADNMPEKYLNKHDTMNAQRLLAAVETVQNIDNPQVHHLERAIQEFAPGHLARGEQQWRTWAGSMLDAAVRDHAETDAAGAVGYLPWTILRSDPKYQIAGLIGLVRPWLLGRLKETTQQTQMSLPQREECYHGEIGATLAGLRGRGVVSFPTLFGALGAAPSSTRPDWWPAVVSYFNRYAAACFSSNETQGSSVWGVLSADTRRLRDADIDLILYDARVGAPAALVPPQQLTVQQWATGVPTPPPPLLQHSSPKPAGTYGRPAGEQFSPGIEACLPMRVGPPQLHLHMPMPPAAPISGGLLPIGHAPGAPLPVHPTPHPTATRLHPGSHLVSTNPAGDHGAALAGPLPPAFLAPGMLPRGPPTHLQPNHPQHGVQLQHGQLAMSHPPPMGCHHPGPGAEPLVNRQCSTAVPRIVATGPATCAGNPPPAAGPTATHTVWPHAPATPAMGSPAPRLAAARPRRPTSPVYAPPVSSWHPGCGPPGRLPITRMAPAELLGDGAPAAPAPARHPPGSTTSTRTNTPAPPIY